MNYRPVYAAGDADQVMAAGWNDPMNHRYGLGIYVKLHHPNGYQTSYGHMSAIAVQACSAPGCVSLPHGEMLGISGNTGNSAGPHLHFRVVTPGGRPIDPYGWAGAGSDPWVYNQPYSLWLQYPSIQPYSGGTALILPKGEPLAYPSSVPPGAIVDDAGAGFSESPAGCWMARTAWAG